MFAKILIANRGEIACRIIRTAQRLGVATTAVYSEADRASLHVALADEAILIGPAAARESYLAGDRIIAAALHAGAEAVHPGYGFLSENAGFAEACAAAGLVFIGPPAAAIRAMGDKSRAKALMGEAGVPLIPGYHGEDQTLSRLTAEADAIGYPVLLKPSGGGGGKGMKIVASGADFVAQLASAKREAMAAFGDDRMLLERYLRPARHVEVQIFADARGACVHLFDRDCSIQRRHQKIIEEAPAPELSGELRQAMREAALRGTRAASYVGAGTIEFLVSPKDGAFYLLEMNARLQVEHPVTEMITGLDLVEWQLRAAAGEGLPLAQEQIVARGHAIEARLYAEDPARDFVPQSGRLECLDFPKAGRHVRIDSGCKAGDEILVHYDPMIAKLIVWDEDRSKTILRLRHALSDMRVAGLATNLGFLTAIASSESFAQAAPDAGFIERHRAALLAPAPAASAQILALAVIGLLRECARAVEKAAARSGDPWSPWNRQDAWRLNEAAEETCVLRETTARGAENRVIQITYLGEGWRLTTLDSVFLRATGALAEDGVLSFDLDGWKSSARWIRADGKIVICMKGQPCHCFALADRGDDAATSEEPRRDLTSPMPGRIVAFLVEPGTIVEANQPVLVVEAMKMEHLLRAPSSGIVRAFKFALGDQVAEGAKLVSFEADAG
ncbi:MAG: biotin carboxylase N-terminal domain-containing protein [Methylocella sp.]